ncbi:MAG: hypothetical protein AAF401_04450 [Pseudomonadota bacterium]
MATLRSMPVIPVSDVTAAEAFWARCGFSSHGAWGDPPKFAIVQRGEVTFALDRHDGALPQNQWWAAYVYVEDAEALKAEFAAEGLETTDMHRPDDYGCIDFDVIDPDGNRIAFGQALNPVPGPGLDHDRGRG